MTQLANKLDKYIVPDNCNYIACFLCFACQLRCPYCINHHGGDLLKGRYSKGTNWVQALNRLQTRSDLPITIQGGEPTVHKDFYYIVNNIDTSIPIDLLTNFQMDIDKFFQSVDPDRLRRESPYASIRVSYHHGQMDFDQTVDRVTRALRRGYHIGIWEVNHPEYYQDVAQRQVYARSHGIDYRLKDFLGPWKGKVYGTMNYPEAVGSDSLKSCMCKTSELLIDPNIDIYRCHSDLYAGRCSIASLLDEQLPQTLLNYMPCNIYGMCNSCDIKLKTNRFQQHGHCSVEVCNITDDGLDALNVKHPENTYGRGQKKPLQS